MPHLSVALPCLQSDDDAPYPYVGGLLLSHQVDIVPVRLVFRYPDLESVMDEL